MTKDEYRNKLILKLKALVAVLRVAIQKLEHAGDQPGVDLERINKITDNLHNTLQICNRALDTLQKTGTTARKPSPSGAREYTEMSSVDEYRKFQDMPPITSDEVAATDINDLIQQLLP